MNQPLAPPHLLECTVRDGSYAIDFMFTERDVSLFARALAALGFHYIEIGHGVGLGASEAGKGPAPDADAQVIAAAKQAAPDAAIGSFCIPGIAKLEHIALARQAGLDFLRVGYDAPDIEKTFPFVEEARAHGLFVAVNLMKSYGISPQAFAEKARLCAAAGAQVVYLVDSAGCMLPEQVATYIERAREATDVDLGFHGHNNLHLAIANTLSAYLHGCSFLDTTLYGLGRSAGNAPSEVMIAILEKLGVSTGFDLFEVMSTAEDLVLPLVTPLQMHNMMAVTAGYSCFHSSFLPKVAEIAGRHRVDLRRLVAAAGLADPVSLHPDELAETAAEMAGAASPPRPPSDLLSFARTELVGDRISTGLPALRALVSGLTVAAAKRQGRVVLELNPALAAADPKLLAEFVTQDDRTVIGRVTFQSLDHLQQIIELTREAVSLYLLNEDGEGWQHEHWPTLRAAAGGRPVVPLRREQLVSTWLLDIVRGKLRQLTADTVIVYGADARSRRLVRDLTREFRHVCWWAPPGIEPEPDAIMIHHPEDHYHTAVQADVIICSRRPDEPDCRALGRALAQEGCLLAWPQAISADLQRVTRGRLQKLDPGAAYHGMHARWRALLQPTPKPMDVEV